MAARGVNVGKRGIILASRLLLMRRLQTSGCQLNKDGFDEAWLEILACPLTKGPLKYVAERQELVSEEIGFAYPIVNGIPNLVPTDARKISASEDSTTT